ncbi:MAG: DUF4295 domain-containing protein [Bacteroidetes bacterium]|nr:DUF4295 domain-containing protein [Bacteroidota bacterium]
MAKKVIAKLKGSTGKNITKVIRAVKSPKSGAYAFKEEIMTLEEAKKILSSQQ